MGKNLKKTHRLGKKLRDWEDEYQYFSGKASEVNRTLALGGIAVIWVFHEDSPLSGPALELQFIWPLAFLTLSLFFDLVHYFAGAEIWYNFFLYHEKNTPVKEHDNIKAPVWKRKVVSSFFYIKVFWMVAAYISLIVILFNKLSWNG
ncbi:MAG: hypothetical protein C0490_16945 [Marivirga sp.]|nr:hypothetical protein [Marivirga sp.]